MESWRAGCSWRWAGRGATRRVRSLATSRSPSLELGTRPAAEGARRSDSGKGRARRPRGSQRTSFDSRGAAHALLELPELPAQRLQLGCTRVTRSLSTLRGAARTGAASLPVAPTGPAHAIAWAGARPAGDAARSTGCRLSSSLFPRERHRDPGLHPPGARRSHSARTRTRFLAEMYPRLLARAKRLPVRRKVSVRPARPRVLVVVDLPPSFTRARARRLRLPACRRYTVNLNRVRRSATRNGRHHDHDDLRRSARRR